jgi:DNA-binding MarR family transcriptional regulator
MIEQMRRVVRSVQAVLAASASDAGLSQSDFQALVRLVAADGMSGADVGRILGVTSSSITELADRLERAGMIARTRALYDRRLVVLKPTAHGRHVVERTLGPVLIAMAAVVDGLQEAELEVVGRFLDEVERGLVNVIAE